MLVALLLLAQAEPQIAVETNVVSTPSPTPTPTATVAPKKKAFFPHIPPILQEVEDKYTAAGTVVAYFEQITESAVLGTKKKSAGVIQVKRPNKIRWEVQRPDPSLTVSDGATFWFYTPPFDENERGQVAIKKAKDVQAPLAHAILAGRFRETRGVKIIAQGPTKFSLLPTKKKNLAGIRRAEIEIDPTEKVIRKVTLKNEGGNETVITLNKVELGTKLEDTLFTFQIPPRTDRVE